MSWRKADPITGVITKADKRPQEAVASSSQSARKRYRRSMELIPWDALEENTHAKLKQYMRSHTSRAQLCVGPSSPTEKCWVKLETLKAIGESVDLDLVASPMQRSLGIRSDVNSPTYVQMMAELAGVRPSWCRLCDPKECGCEGRQGKSSVLSRF